MDRKRIWVRRPHGAATTVLVSASDIVDDLKTALIGKYATSLGRTHDAPDISIRMSHAGTPSGQHSPHGRRKRRGDTVRRELAAALDPHVVSQQHTHQPGSPSEEDDRVLQPDEVVFALLDKFFPTGMSMQDAFLVEVPDDIMPVPSHNRVPIAGVLTPQEGVMSDDEIEFLRGHIPDILHAQSSQSLPDEARYYLQSHRHGLEVLDQQQRASSADPYGAHPYLLQPGSFRQSHGHVPRKQTGSSASGRSGASGSVSMPVVVSSTMIPQITTQPPSHPGPSRPQPQPIQQHVDAHALHSAGPRGVVDDEGRVGRARSPHRTASPHPHPLSHNHPHSHSHSGTVTPTQQTQAQSHVNVKSPLQNVTRYEGDSASSAARDSSDVERETTILPINANIKESKADTSEKKDNADEKSINGTGLKDKSSRQREKASQQVSLGSGLLFDGVVPPVKVLIVEDNIINQKILETFMRKRRIRSGVAKNGKEAIEKWREGGYHLVLMDIQLPVLSGIEATKEIRRLERRNRIGVFVDEDAGNIKEEDVLPPHRFKSPVIIVALTASSLDSDRREALAAGCNDFLTKPVNLVWLERKITEWGCMQALIDFEGWRSWKGSDDAEKDANGSSTSNSRTSRRPKAVIRTK
ncbi:hypothetical protein V1520DRAFT_333081 [Lipomyces starkeyi]|uniref:Response regulatory domain-containing protein n=1 Tax=Lipomyces starkeyi NRRL Y-11557 TaxID=675824 RepID=A0A1E3Q653_LIPST|nr:hypothetical protein LIPSTDRAFT_3310 [Lipomyces starkeyi NRRL Y-11557]